MFTALCIQLNQIDTVHSSFPWICHHHRLPESFSLFVFSSNSCCFLTVWRFYMPFPPSGTSGKTPIFMVICWPFLFFSVALTLTFLFNQWKLRGASPSLDHACWFANTPAFPEHCDGLSADLEYPRSSAVLSDLLKQGEWTTAGLISDLGRQSHESHSDLCWCPSVWCSCCSLPLGPACSDASPGSIEWQVRPTAAWVISFGNHSCG